MSRHLDTLAESISVDPTEDATKFLKMMPAHDPSLPTLRRSKGYIDVFVNDFIALAQGYKSKSLVQKILLHTIDLIFHALNPKESSYKQEPVSLKKLKQGDCTWSTNKKILGWIINTVVMTVTLPKHCIDCLAEILSSIPSIQWHIGVTKWHKVLGKPCP